jgi:hypothetical protein
VMESRRCPSNSGHAAPDSSIRVSSSAATRSPRL